MATTKTRAATPRRAPKKKGVTFAAATEMLKDAFADKGASPRKMCPACGDHPVGEGRCTFAVPPPTDARTRATITHEDADAIIRLIDHAEKKGLAFLEGPGGLRFGFRKAQAQIGRSLNPNNLPGLTGDDHIP